MSGTWAKIIFEMPAETTGNETVASVLSENVDTRLHPKGKIKVRWVSKVKYWGKIIIDSFQLASLESYIANQPRVVLAIESELLGQRAEMGNKSHSAETVWNEIEDITLELCSRFSVAPNVVEMLKLTLMPEETETSFAVAVRASWHEDDAHLLFLFRDGNFKGCKFVW